MKRSDAIEVVNRALANQGPSPPQLLGHSRGQRAADVVDGLIALGLLVLSEPPAKPKTIEDEVVEVLTSSMLKVRVLLDAGADRLGPSPEGWLSAVSARIICRHLHDLGFVVGRDEDREAMQSVNAAGREALEFLKARGFKIVRV